MPLTATLSAQFNVSAYTKVINALQTGAAAFKINPSISFTNGEAVNQAEVGIALVESITAAGNNDIDLAGVEADAFGDTITFTTIKGLIFEAPSANDSFINVGGEPTNPFLGPFANGSDIIKVEPGGFIVLCNPTAAGWAVTAGTGDILRLNNPGAITNILNVGIIGTV